MNAHEANRQWRATANKAAIKAAEHAGSFWDSPEWHAYERAYGDEPGTRSRLLASAGWQTQIVDLTQSEADLWRGVRKSYKSLIRKVERDDNPQIRRAGGPSGILWCSTVARALHIEAAERETRSLETWAIMDDWHLDGGALLMLARRPQDVDFSAFAYFVIWKRWAYYFSAASLLPDVNHALIWRGAMMLKARGVHRLEMGWIGQAADDKGKQIEFFRQGFGGTARPVREVYALPAL